MGRAPFSKRNLMKSKAPQDKRAGLKSHAERGKKRGLRARLAIANWCTEIYGAGMRMRGLAILTALWWALWTIVIVPMHTRGAIPLVERGCPACCCCGPVGAGHSDEKAPPARENSENCAICHVVATLATTPVLPVFVQRFVALWRVEALGEALAVREGGPERLLCRGPPVG